MSVPQAVKEAERSAGGVQFRYISCNESASGAGMKPLSVAFGIFRIEPRGGAENLCLQIAASLEARGHAVTIVTTAAPSTVPGRILRIEGATRPRTNHGRVRVFAAAFADATRSGYDRTVAFQPMPAQIVVLVHRMFDRPDKPLWKRATPRFRTLAGLEAACMARGSEARLIGLTRGQVAEFAERYDVAPERIAIMPPPVAPAMRRAEPVGGVERKALLRDFGISGSGPLWLWIGLQPETKGLDRVIQALACVPEAELLVCGVPKDAPKARPALRLARRLSVEKRIAWLGYVPPGDDRLAGALRVADVLAHPARSEAAGMVILEAIFNGLPVVATALCGYGGHILESGCGAVIQEPFDLDRFVDALRIVAAQHDRMTGKGIAYGTDPSLYSGVASAADLIEAPLDRPWPPTLRLRGG